MTTRPFFLGDFSHGTDDRSRPSALVIQLAPLPKNAMTFTLGDRMTVAEQPTRRVYSHDEMVDLLENDGVVAEFCFSDQYGLNGLSSKCSCGACRAGNFARCRPFRSAGPAESGSAA
jgi:hypothetical protein